MNRRVAATLVGALAVGIVAIFAATLLQHGPDHFGRQPDGEAAPSGPLAALEAAPSIGALRRDTAFLTLSAGMALALFAQIGLLAQLVSLLVPALGAKGAGFAAGLATAAAILGRTLVGWLMPADADRRLVASVSLLVQALGCAAFVAGGGSSVPLMLAGVVLLGLGIGNATSLPPPIA